MTTENILTAAQIAEASEIGAAWGRDEVSLYNDGARKGMSEWTTGTYCGNLSQFATGLENEDEIEAAKQAAEEVIDKAAAEVWNTAKAEDDERRAMLKAVKTADDLEDLLAAISDKWYAEVDGDYSGVPTWGPKTQRVEEMISASCADGDIVSWDTRDADPANHRYLVRKWVPAHERHQPEHDFEITQ